MKAVVKQVGGYAMLGRANSGHWVPMDGSVKIGATDGAARPKELLLLALGGCTAFDVEMILRKRRAGLEGLEIEMEADEVAEHPMVFSEIRMAYHVRGDVPVADIERAIRLSKEKYCSVSAMLAQVFPIRWRATLNGEPVLEGAPV